MNMSVRFTFLLQSGFLISLLWFYFYVTYACQYNHQKRMKNLPRNSKWYSFLSLSSLLHFYLLIYWRLYIKQGQICAGDYDGAISHLGKVAMNSADDGSIDVRHEVSDYAMRNLMSNGDETNLIDITLLPRKVLEM